MIPITKPFLPHIDEYSKYIESIWERNHLTNNGPLVQELENKLKSYLGINDIVVVGNGTIALQIAIKTLALKGEIITTPFSYVATTSSVVWENCKPVFVDIDENDYNIDPKKIEEKITNDTSAILATHVFGVPCKMKEIEAIATRNGLKVIYDAAHGFGVKVEGKSLFEYGDISVTSFHATKVFQTIEGGAIFASNEELIKRLKWKRNFGHAGPEKFSGLGINGKLSEFHAAMGLCNLKYSDQLLEKRKSQYLLYTELLKESDLQFQNIEGLDAYNYSYFPVVFPSTQGLLKAKTKLEQKDIYPRRYFYPLLSDLSYVDDADTPIARSISERILCLPMYFELSDQEIESIAELIN